MKNLEDYYFQVLLFFGQFLVHLEEAGDDVGLGGVFGEAVSLLDSGVVGDSGRKQCV